MSWKSPVLAPCPTNTNLRTILRQTVFRAVRKIVFDFSFEFWLSYSFKALIQGFFIPSSISSWMAIKECEF